MSDSLSNCSAKIMTRLDHNKLKDLKEYFKNTDSGLSLEEFVGVMLAFISDDAEDPRDDMLILNIIELFKQIDVNDDGTLEWEEFSNHIIESGMSKKEGKFVHQMKLYHPSTNEDFHRHEAEIYKLYFFKHLSQIFMIPRDSREFKIFSKRLQFIRSVGGHKGSVTALEYIRDRDLMASCSTDCYVNFYDTNNWVKMKGIRVDDIQKALKYSYVDQDTHYLISGGVDKCIYFYDLKKFSKRKLELLPIGANADPNAPKVGHKEVITDLLLIPERDLFFSCAMDGLIICWDISTISPPRKFEGHKKGVLQLAYINDFLVSAGLDTEVLIWNPYVSKRVSVLKGHQHPTAGVRTLEDNHQIVTADISACFKVWDARSFTLVQSFYMQMSDLSAFVVTFPLHKVVGGFKKLAAWDYDEPKDDKLVDEQPAIRVFFNREFFVFITVHADCLKYWDSKTGEILSVMRDLSKHQINEAIMDHRERKIFLGLSNGSVSCFNLNNGAEMKRFEEHTQEVSCLSYYGPKKELVSVGMDGHFIVSDDSRPDKDAITISRSRKDKKDTVKPFTCTAIFEGAYEGINRINNSKYDIHVILNLMGNTDGIVYVMDMANYRITNEFRLEDAAVALCVLGSHPLVAASDDGGRVTIWPLRPSTIAYRKHLWKLDNNYSLEDDYRNVTVNVMQYVAFYNYLILGDVNGCVRLYNVGLLTERHAKYNSNFQFQEDRMFFATEVDWKAPSEDFLPKDMDVSHVMTFRAHGSGLTALNCSLDCSPHILFTCSQNCEVFFWDLTSKVKQETNHGHILSKIGNLVIKTNRIPWVIQPDVEKKIDRYRQMKNEILENALKIKEIINGEYREYSKDKSHYENGVVNVVKDRISRRLQDKFEEDEGYTMIFGDAKKLTRYNKSKLLQLKYLSQDMESNYAMRQLSVLRKYNESIKNNFLEGLDSNNSN